MTDLTDPRLDVLLPLFDHRPDFTAVVLGSVDAADRAAGIVRVDTTDEVLVHRLAQAIHRALLSAPSGFEDFHGARAVLAALREAQ